MRLVLAGLLSALFFGVWVISCAIVSDSLQNYSYAAEPIREQFRADEMRVTVVYATDRGELRELAHKYNVPIPIGHVIHGFSVTRYSPNANTSECLIVALEPQYVNDSRVTTLGHELLHCMVGAYHD